MHRHSYNLIKHIFNGILHFSYTVLLPLLVLSAITLTFSSSIATTNYSKTEENNNPLFSNRYSDQIVLHMTMSARHLESLYALWFQYSQSNSLFHLNGRGNFEMGGFLGFKNLDAYSQLFFGLSQDLILPLDLIPLSFFKHFYVGAGLGIYIKTKMTNRIGSKVTFGEKFFLGYGFGNWNFEFFEKHFSNGDFTEANSGQDLLGIAIIYNFR